MSEREYTYAKYLSDFAAWAAGSAVTQIGFSFKVKDGQDILKATGFDDLAEKGTEWLPDPNGFDAEHRVWCKKVCEEAKRLGMEDWSYGRSAKLINVFLKTLMPLNLETLPEEEKAKWLAVHPPIDGRVLEGMKRAGIGSKTVWAGLREETDSRLPYGAWTRFKYKHYEKVIDMIRRNLRECGYKDPLPLWKNERFFKG